MGWLAIVVAAGVLLWVVLVALGIAERLQHARYGDPKCADRSWFFRPPSHVETVIVRGPADYVAPDGFLVRFPARVTRVRAVSQTLTRTGAPMHFNATGKLLNTDRSAVRVAIPITAGHHDLSLYSFTVEADVLGRAAAEQPAAPPAAAAAPGAGTGEPMEAVREEVSEADVRAEALLRAYLSPEQRADYDRSRHFVVRGGRSGQPYTIDVRAHSFNVSLPSGATFCAYAPGVPDADNALTQAILLRMDEDRFIRTANPGARGG